MASETLEEKKQEEEAPKEELKQEQRKEEDVNPQLSEKEVYMESEEKTVEEEKAVEGKEEEEEEEEAAAAAEVTKKVTPKRDRKGNLKKPSQDSAEMKPSQESAEKKEKQKEKEPVTPSSDRPTRERKIVERYSAPSVRSSSTKPLSIEKGRGEQLKDIPNVAFKLSKRKPDDNLQILHTILFGKKAKAHSLKRNIGQFSGFVWLENEEKQKAKVREKLDKCVKEKLMDFCDVLNIPINRGAVKKEELSVKLLEFLESPHATTDILLADKEQKGKKRKVTPSKKVSPGEASDTPAKKRKPTSQVGEKQKLSSKAEEEDEYDNKVDSPDAKDYSDEDNDNFMTPKGESDHEETKSDEEEDEPKEQMSGKKGSSKKNVREDSRPQSKDKSTTSRKGSSAKSVKTPLKSAKKSPGSTSKQGAYDADGTSKSKASKSKKHKVEKEPKDQSVSNKDKATGKRQSNKSPAKVPAKDQGKGKTSKKGKAEPSREEMHAVVVDILKEVDFNTATLSDILRQLGTHFGVDLMHRKAEVKDIITDVINNMSDEEDEGEEAEAEDDTEADGDDDADKDGDGDDDA